VTPAAIYTAVRDLIVLGVLGFIVWRIYTDGANAVKVTDMAAVQKQLAANASQVAQWQKESSDANLKRESELAQVSATIGAQRAPVLVCHGPASPDPVPSAAPTPDSGPTASRGFNAGSGASAQPVNVRPAINAVELKYERALTECRSALAKWPTETPK